MTLNTPNEIYSESMIVSVLTLHICSNLNSSDSIVMGAYPKSHLQRLVTGLQCLKNIICILCIYVLSVIYLHVFVY